jgi:uncharacterized protein (DUF983 family)
LYLIVWIRVHIVRVKEIVMSQSFLDALRAGLACRCPRCGQGRLFAGYLQIAPRCEKCGLSFDGNDTAGGPAFFVMMPLSILTAVLALLFEIHAAPPLWQHIIIWPIFIVVCIGLMLRPVKSTLVALQYRYRDVGNSER